MLGGNSFPNKKYCHWYDLSDKFSISQVSSSNLQNIEWLFLQTKSISFQSWFSIADKGFLQMGPFGIYPIVKPNGSVRNKICTPTLPLIMRTGFHPNADFNSPHSPVWRRWTLGCWERKLFQSVRETIIMVKSRRSKVEGQ